MKILIFGASGRTGHELVSQALEQGHEVYAFVRNPEKLNVKHFKLHAIQGDVVNEREVENAVAGKEAVISALGATSPFKYDQTVVDGLENIIRAMEMHQVKRLVYMSAINVGDSISHAGLLIRCLAPLLLRSETKGHEARERIIRNSKVDWTLVRAAGLNNGKLTNQYRSGIDVYAKGIAAAISRADVASFMIKQLTDSSYIRKAPLVMY